MNINFVNFAPFRQPYSESFVTKSITVQAVPDLFGKKYLNTQYSELLEICADVNIEITPEQVKIIEEDTRKQSVVLQDESGLPLASRLVKLTQLSHPIPLLKQYAIPTFLDLAMLLQSMAASMKNKL